MLITVVAVIFGLLGWLVTRDHYRGTIEDLRRALEHERKMRRYEEDRAESLSDALFDRAQTRTKRVTGLMN